MLTGGTECYPTPTLDKLNIFQYAQTRKKLERYVERYFQRKNGKIMQPFPTIRDCAKSLKLRQNEIEQLVGDSDILFLSYWNVNWDPPLGEMIVESCNDYDRL